MKAIEEDLLTFYNYPKAEFPTEESLDTFVGTLVTDYNTRHFDRAHKGFKQVEDTLESYFG